MVYVCTYVAILKPPGLSRYVVLFGCRVQILVWFSSAATIRGLAFCLTSLCLNGQQISKI